uniref:Temptin Cys/Cys disulfide domain-containing protein n=1 Tax=Globisporangium ultimum (strain ATCC 200006 / CBS 805.95 / DAOM BR144) TaxID=431595 RepID=K3X113_GLOUD
MARSQQLSLATACVLVALTLQSAAARPEYVEMLPNGANTGVEALGHTNHIGGGSLTAFGEDFAVAGHKWTKALCEKDSDGDGQTNGQELGDPCCAWTLKTYQRVEWIKGVSSPADATKTSDPALWVKINCTTVNADSVSTTAPKSAPTPSLASGAATSSKQSPAGGRSAAILSAVLVAVAVFW